METIKKGEPATAYSSASFGRDFSFTIDKPVGAMSISPCGRDVVLASRQGLHVIDLDSPYAPPRHLPHYTPWEVADVQWSPYPSRDYWVVSTSNQKALVWNLMMRDTQSSVEHYLHAHTRAITDINFSCHHPDVLATCAVDSFVHCWDLRHPQRPALSFADWFASATQVKWNRQDSHVIASSHDKFLRIWDNRKGAHPLHSIEAHDTKIYGLDWNRVRSSALVTCSLDKTIKFWDYSASTENPERVIKTSFPIWRARHTPFGRGVLAMPQRDDNELYLYDTRDNASEQNDSLPVKSFPGHEGQVKEFLWRCRGTIDGDDMDNREFQLVTWGADKKLRLHPMDEQSLAGVDFKKGMKANRSIHLTRANATYKSFRETSEISDLTRAQSSTSLTDSKQNTEPFKLTSAGMTLRGRSSATIGGFPNGRTAVNPKMSRQKGSDPITWMKGVKAGKKEIPLDQSIHTIPMIDPRLHRGSEDFQNLGEEITHVGSKFTKVRFLEMDVNQRYMKIAIHGIWSDKKDSSTYLECRIEIPEDYPHANAPYLMIEETALLGKEKLNKLENDVSEIGEAYLKFKRNSLEAIVRYLHGDQTLDDVLNWTKQELDTSMTDFRPRDESSSDEDEIDSNDAEFDLGGSGFLEAPNPHAYMPLAKPCAGVWAPNGTLVCFFPPKQEDNTSLVGSLRLNQPGGLLKTGRHGLLGDFGKINRSRRSRPKTRSVSSMDSRESAIESESSDSEQSSSASSLSSDDETTQDVSFITHHVFDADRFGLSTHGTDRFLEGTLKSGESGAGSALKLKQPKSILRCHDLRSLLPPKEELAAEYVITGTEACKMNASAANKHDYKDLAEVWTLLDFLLHGKPLSIDQLAVLPSLAITGVAALQVPGLGNAEGTVLRLSSFVDWHQHPFGRQRLIAELLDYYLKLSDIQMLAMMVSIIAERDATILQTAPEMPAPVRNYRRSPAIRKLYDKEYFPDLKESFSVSPENDTFKTSASSMLSPVKSRYEPNSLSSSMGTVIHEGDSFESSMINLHQNRSSETSRRGPKLSSSPELYRPLYKSSTNLANAVMSSISRPFSMTASAASSPPTISFMKKKISPAGSLTPLSAWTSSNSPPIQGATRLSSTRNSEKRVRISRQPSMSKPTVRMTARLKNQENFQSKAQMDVSLLDPAQMPTYRLWQEEYAEMLRSWDLLLPYAEMLKGIGFNSLTNSNGSASSNENPPRNLNSSREVLPSIGCSICGATARPEHTNTTCASCHELQITSCILCNLVIQGRSSPCLVCGHILHIACRTEWYLSGIFECPAGCGCDCVSPSLPAEGIVTQYSASTPQVDSVSTRATRSSSSKFDLPSSRRLSPAASVSGSTIRGFSLAPSVDNDGHPHRSQNGDLHSATSSTGARTPYEPSMASTHQVAYQSLQSLAAQSRPRGGTTGTHLTKGQQLSASYSTSGRGSKVRHSKSLMFVAGMGSNAGHGGTHTGGQEGRRGRADRSSVGGGGSSGASTPSHASTRAAKAKAAQTDRKSERQDLTFELGFSGEEDSDIDSVGL